MEIVLAVLVIYLIYQVIELNRFSVKKVSFTHDTLTGSFVFLSDVHGNTYGDLKKKKSRLVKKITELSPEGIILGGDTVSKKHPEQYEVMLELIRQLKEVAPVYYLFGNHETALEIRDEERFADYIKKLEEMGVLIYRNQEFFPCMNKAISCYALELPLSQYEKRVKKPLSEDIVEDVRCKWKGKGMRFLFVHQPTYADEFAKLFTDGIFCGHTHGGLVRIPGIGGLLDPELNIFPKYDGGTYLIGEEKRTKLVVSQGVGTHHFHIRVFDSAQLVYVTINSCKDDKN